MSAARPDSPEHKSLHLPRLRGCAVRDAAKHLLFDPTVAPDPGKEPSIYVTYHDAQAYPEYLIKFSQTNVPKAHPAAGEAPHRMYRHNILEAEGIE